MGSCAKGLLHLMQSGSRCNSKAHLCFELGDLSAHGGGLFLESRNDFTVLIDRRRFGRQCSRCKALEGN